MVISCAICGLICDNSCDKLTKSELGQVAARSNIGQNHLYIYQNV